MFFPDEAIGQDIGELVAAAVSGILTLEDALKLASTKDSIEFQQIAETLVYHFPQIKIPRGRNNGDYR